ncbi:MAG TPA: hypothetical protein VGM88_26435 [Kofleriaceae bacterium]|jgi:hypothetical protein
MPLTRYVGLVDLGVLTIVAVTVLLPPREMYASPAQEGTDQERFALALAEARTMANPADGAAADELAKLLGTAGFKDWAIEDSVKLAKHADSSPTGWRALLAASVAYVDHMDVKPALEYANHAMAACDQHPETCPAYESARMSLYERHLDAGVKSGIDPHKNPRGFRDAGMKAIRAISIGDMAGPAAAGSAGSNAPTDNGSAAPTP